ncbi:MAG: hypothetical protein ABFE08_16185 [Armatimonadia bacterium]
MPTPFPSIPLDILSAEGQDANPAVQLFGRRFFADQTVPELLIELLLVAASPKRIGNTSLPVDRTIPGLDSLCDWPEGQPLRYSPRARLNLKLFAFMGASKLASRHSSHREHYISLLAELQSPERLRPPEGVSPREVVQTLENLFLGFQAIGGRRTWCAQAFTPICPEVLAGDTIWNETEARRRGVTTWAEVAEKMPQFFTVGRHRFVARGGEVLYLQLCNALRQSPEQIRGWCEEADIGFGEDERSPERVRDALEVGLRRVLTGQCPEGVGALARFIDQVIEPETSQQTDCDDGGQPRFSDCGWCPSEGWPEGWLFALELVHVCAAAVDPIERLELMQTACALQLLRSLCAQSARYVEWAAEVREYAGPLGFVWALSDASGDSTPAKRISQRCVSRLQRLIREALRHPEIEEAVARRKYAVEANGKQANDLYPEADTRYGHKLFLSVAKRLGLIVPRQGPGARFVLNEHLLRYLVLSLLPPGKRVTYEGFKDLMFAHYGLAVDDRRLGASSAWCGRTCLLTLGGEAEAWFMSMLEAAGFLVRLSDADSLVQNPFVEAERQA